MKTQITQIFRGNAIRGNVIFLKKICADLLLNVLKNLWERRHSCRRRSLAGTPQVGAATFLSPQRNPQNANSKIRLKICFPKKRCGDKNVAAPTSFSRERGNAGTRAGDKNVAAPTRSFCGNDFRGNVIFLKKICEIWAKICVICVLIIAFPSAFADDVWIKNGSVLRGTISSLSGNYLKLQTDISNRDEIYIKREEIASITIGHTCEVVLKNKERVLGELEPSVDDGFVVVGGNEINIADIVEINTKDALVLAREREEKRRLKTEVEVGIKINGQSGNTDSLNSTLHFQTLTKNDTFSFKTYADYGYGKYKSYGGDWTKSADKLSTGCNLQDDFYDPWLCYFRTENGFDRTLNKRFYSYSAAGLGWNAIKKDNHTLAIRVGLTYRYENYHDFMGTLEADSDRYLSRSGLDVSLSHEYKWSTCKIVTELTYAPLFEDFRDHFIITHETYFQTEVPEFRNMYFKIGVKNNYDSVAENPKNHDCYFYSALIFRWK